ncbi:recombinase family protein [Bacillus infantis]|uniref:recombinase family protein n=1 Tax=Bacillus infantis TaxID=324767 RepID=UPI003CF82F45
MDEKNKLAISYCRKSTRVKGKSVEESVGYQQEAINQYARKNGIQIVKGFSDVGVSGKDTNRPELQEMIHFLKTTNEKISELIIYSIDRFGRDLQHNIQQMLEILQLVEKVSFVSQPITSDTTYFKLLFLTLTAVAQDERERLLTRCANGRKQKVLSRKSFDGNYKPFGMVKKDDSEKLIAAKPLNVLEPSMAQEFIQIQYIFYLYMYNYPLRRIASILNEKFGKTKRGVDWTYKSVKYILQNPVYLGKLRGVLEGSTHYLIDNANVESIIDPATFMLIQRKLQFEKAGRKKREVSQSPYFNLCYSCGSYLEKESGMYACRKCVKSVDTLIVEEKIKNSLMNFLKFKELNHSCIIKKHLLELRESDEERLRAGKIELKKLESRLNEIERLEINEDLKTRLRSTNTVETRKLNMKMEELRRKINYFENNELNYSCIAHSKEAKDFLIRTPFIVLYNFIEKEVVILPNKNLLKKDAVEQ